MLVSPFPPPLRRLSLLPLCLSLGVIAALPPVAAQADAQELFARMETDAGTILLQFDPELAPRHVANFVMLARTDFYNGTYFHRVIPGFMIQGGCPRGDGRGSPGYKFNDEFVKDLNFDRPGLLAMANSGPDSNGSQFFITEEPTPHLNQRHTIFGEVVDEDGLLTVRKIARVERDARDKPLEPVVMTRVIIKRVAAGAPTAEGAGEW